MRVREQHDIIERGFLPWRLPMGADHERYKNHVYRVFNFACALVEQHPETVEQYNGLRDVEERIAHAACYHDAAIWTHHTLDYLEPSVELMLENLGEGHRAKWREEIALMIRFHHKLTRYRGEHEILVESFRRADLADLTFGLQSFGLPRLFVRAVQKRFPYRGFHRTLAVKLTRYAVTHPWKPFPMMRP